MNLEADLNTLIEEVMWRKRRIGVIQLNSMVADSLNHFRKQLVSLEPVRQVKKDLFVRSVIVTMKMFGYQDTEGCFICVQDTTRMSVPGVG